MKRLIRIAMFLSALVALNLQAQWVQTNGPHGGTVQAFAVTDTSLFVGTEYGGIFVSTDEGVDWKPVNTGLRYSFVTALAVSGTDLFAGTRGGGVFLSTNGGSSWSPVDSGLANTYVVSVVMSGSNLFAGTDGGVFLSTNSGTSWTAVNSGLTNIHVNALAVNGTNLFAGSYGVYLSTNNGKTWIPTGLAHYAVLSFAVSGPNLFAGTEYGGVFLSTDNGASWTAANNGLPAGVTGFQALAVSDENVFAGTWSGEVFLSTDNGTSWTAVNEGLTAVYVKSLAVTGTYLFAGTLRALWRRPLSEMLTPVERVLTDSPTHFSLDQNYPNPFNPSTTITFGVPRSAFVELNVYDILGRKVATLVNELIEPGWHRATWKAPSFASGVYLYRMNANSFVETKKLILMR
jgi:photosystem II stability/assembly factor-like uncharacterized protein